MVPDDPPFRCAPEPPATSYAWEVIESTSVPSLVVDRVLLPGERASLPVRTAALLEGVAAGSIVVLSFSGASDDRVGVLAEVESLRPLDRDVAIVSLRARARVEAVETSDSGMVRVGTAEDGGGVTAEQIDATVVALRRYLGSLAEYGEPVDVYPDMPEDPILASYAVASLLDVSAGERQTLLEADTAAQRFALLKTILSRERTLLEATMRAKGI